MTRVIHTGDTHIGYQQYNSPERRRDFLEAFREVAADAVADGVDAVVHAGDLFHDRRPDLVDLQGTIDVLRSLDDAGVPFLAIVGNHESKRDAQWLDLFADLGLATRLGREPTVVGDVAFYGLDYVPESRRPELEYAFEPPPPATTHAVLVAHGLFEPFPHATWDTETVLAESTVDFDAVLLGDNHAADTANVDGAWVTYCGSTERTSASERAARGYNLVAFDDEVAISRRALSSTREFAFVDVELAADEGVDRVRERVREHDLEDAVVVVTVEGDGDPFPPAAVEEVAAEAGALVARVTDRREIDADAEVSIQFADPDEAVDERIRELGLSDAARHLDRTIRDTTDVAASNVRETVERRVREALEDDPSAFESAADGRDDAADSPTEPTATDEGASSPADGSREAEDETSTAEDGSREGETSTADDGSQEDEDGDSTAEDGPQEDEDGDSTAEDGSPAPDDEEPSTAGGEKPSDPDGARPPDAEHASLGDFA